MARRRGRLATEARSALRRSGRLGAGSRTYPGLLWTLPLVAAAFGVAAALDLAPALQFDRAAVAAGEWWRVPLCQLTHWTGDHLLYDVLGLVALAALITRGSRTAVCLGLGLVAVPLVVTALDTELVYYRGLSGLVSALVPLAAADLYADFRARGRPGWANASLLLVGGLLAKIGYEFATGQAVAVDAIGYRPVPLAHVVGAGLGGVCWLASWALRRDPRRARVELRVVA